MSASASYSEPETLQAALTELGSAPEWVVLAGGTDLWPEWTRSKRRPARVMSLHRVAELRRLAVVDGQLHIGALVTHRELSASAAVRDAAPALCQAAATVGALEIQRRGTIGGNLASASPAADLPPALLAAGATVELASADGVREVPLEQFFVGYRATARAPGELLTRVRVPVLPSAPGQPPGREYFRKLGTRAAQAISKVVGACRVQLDAEQRVVRMGLGFGSVGPTPLCLSAVAVLLHGQLLDGNSIARAADAACDAVTPIDDLRSTADYRRFVVGQLVRAWLTEAAGACSAARAAAGATPSSPPAH